MEETNIPLNEEKFYVCMDKQHFEEKASSSQIAEISKRIANEIQQVSIDELKTMLTKQGKTMCGAVFKEIDGVRRRKETHFAMQNIFGIDVDGKTDDDGNKIEHLKYGVLFQEVKQIIDKYEIPTQFAYKTFSDGIKGERFRVIFQTDIPIFDSVFSRAIILALQYIFDNYTDQSCKDPNRMFLGGKSVITTDSKYFNQVIRLDDLFKILYTVYKDRYIETHSDTSQITRDFRNYLASNYGINTINNLPFVRKVLLNDEQIEMMKENRIDESDVFPNQHFNINEETHNEIFGKNMSERGSNLYYIYYRTGAEIDRNLHEFYEICMLKIKPIKTKRRKNDHISFYKNEDIKENFERKVVKEENMLERCRLVKELLDNERHIHNDEFFGMSTNFPHMEIKYMDNEEKRTIIGEKYLFKGIEKYCEKNPEELEKRWDEKIEYNKKVGYLPQSCKDFCPYFRDCIPNTNIVNTVCHTTNRIIPLNEDIQYVELDELRQELYKKEKVILEEYQTDIKNKKIKIIKCQTGVGKTYQLVRNIIEQLPNSNCNYIIAVPRHNLKKQVANTFNENGVNVYITPDFDDLEDEKIKVELEGLREKELYGILRERIYKYLELGVSESDEIILKDYLNAGRKVKEYKGVIITTHKKLMYLQKETLENAIVIIDEDIIDTLEETKDICMKDIRELQEILNKNKELLKITHKLKNKIEYICESNYKKYLAVPTIKYTTGERKLIEREIERNNIEYNVFQFLDCEMLYFYNATESKNTSIKEDTIIRTMRQNSLPENNILILSATINEDFYKKLYQDRELEIIEMPIVKYYGKVYQYGNYSFSRDSIENHQELVKDILDNTKGFDLITFKNLLEKYKIEANNFFNVSGLNELDGKNIRILGLPNRNEMYYMNLAYMIYGEKYNEKPKKGFHNINFNNCKVKFYTYDDETLRNIHIWAVSSELEQCVGRARLVKQENKDKVVILFAGLPVQQSIIVNEREVIYKIKRSNIISKCLVIYFEI